MPALVRHSSGALVAMGGLALGEELEATRTAEALYPDASDWMLLPDMHVARCCCSGAVDSRGKIYVVGGGENMYRNSRAWRTTEMMEFVDACCWQQAPSMNDARCGLGVAYSFSTDYLFAAGGYAGGGCYLETAERLHLSTGSSGVWEYIPPMSCKRAGCNAAVGPDHRVYVIGADPTALMHTPPWKFLI